MYTSKCSIPHKGFIGDAGPGRMNEHASRKLNNSDRKIEKMIVSGSRGCRCRGKDDPKTCTGNVPVLVTHDSKLIAIVERLGLPSLVSSKHLLGSCREVMTDTSCPRFLSATAASTTSLSAPPVRSIHFVLNGESTHSPMPRSGWMKATRNDFSVASGILELINGSCQVVIYL